MKQKYQDLIVIKNIDNHWSLIMLNHLFKETSNVLKPFYESIDSFNLSEINIFLSFLIIKSTVFLQKLHSPLKKSIEK